MAFFKQVKKPSQEMDDCEHLSVLRYDRISPSLPWLDDRGLHIQAHGGVVIEVDGRWYWFGEDRSPGNDPDTCPVACYASADLMNWEFRGQVFEGRNPENLAGLWQIERPKVFHHRKTGRFVMYFHIDGQEAGHWSRYRLGGIEENDRSLHG